LRVPPAIFAQTGQIGHVRINGSAIEIVATKTN
jgi:hypothetical protein